MSSVEYHSAMAVSETACAIHELPKGAQGEFDLSDERHGDRQFGDGRAEPPKAEATPEPKAPTPADVVSELVRLRVATGDITVEAADGVGVQLFCDGAEFETVELPVGLALEVLRQLDAGAAVADVWEALVRAELGLSGDLDLIDAEFTETKALPPASTVEQLDEDLDRLADEVRRVIGEPGDRVAFKDRELALKNGAGWKRFGLEAALEALGELPDGAGVDAALEALEGGTGAAQSIAEVRAAVKRVVGFWPEKHVKLDGDLLVIRDNGELLELDHPKAIEVLGALPAAAGADALITAVKAALRPQPKPGRQAGQPAKRGRQKPTWRDNCPSFSGAIADGLARVGLGEVTHQLSSDLERVTLRRGDEELELALGGLLLFVLRDRVKSMMGSKAKDDESRWPGLIWDSIRGTAAAEAEGHRWDDKKERYIKSRKAATATA